MKSKCFKNEDFYNEEWFQFYTEFKILVEQHPPPQSWAFALSMKNRYNEGAGKTDLRMKNVCTETNRCYRDILDRLDALMLINGEATYAPFMKDPDICID